MRNGQLKIAVIGGGSAYTPELIDGLIKRYNEFPVQELYLVDIKSGEEKLEIIGDLTRRMIAEANVPIQLHTTFDRREAIKDADFVCTQIRVGGLNARSLDEEIPLRYGCIGQETTGAGGFAKALRTIPVILDICKDIEELSPSATLVNFTNPAGIVTEAIAKHTNVKAIGLCNLPIETMMQIANLFDVDVSQIDIEVIGINHLNWISRLWIAGSDKIEEAFHLFSDDDGPTVKNIPNLDWDVDFLRSLRMLPCSYLRYYYLKDEMLADQLQAFKTEGTRACMVKKIEQELFQLYKDPTLVEKPSQLEQRGGAYYSEAAVNLMTSIFNNKKDLQIVNVINDGAIPCLPDEAVVEMKCVISVSGIYPVQLSQPVPENIKGLLQVVKSYESLTVEAAITGDKQIGIQALAVHPLVESVSVAKKIMNDILQENKSYLPQFFR